MPLWELFEEMKFFLEKVCQILYTGRRGAEKPFPVLNAMCLTVKEEPDGQKNEMVGSEVGKSTQSTSSVLQIHYYGSAPSPSDSSLAHSNHSVKTCWPNKWMSSYRVTPSWRHPLDHV